MLRKLGTALSRGLVVLGAVVIAVWIWLPGAWAQTQIVLTNALDYTVANGKSLTGTYECSDGGYIDSSCIIGHFPEVSCPAGYAIQVISADISPATCIAVGTGTPAGSDTYVQYNGSGVFAADQNFTWNYVSSILHLGGAGPGEATFGGDVLANLGTPSNGTIAYCSNCTANTSPCTTGGTGSFATRINGAWGCLGAGTGTGTVTSVAQTVPGGFSISGSPVTTSGTLAISANGTSGGVLYYSASNTSASSGALTASKFVLGGGAGAAPTSSAAGDDGTTVTSGARDFSYAQALYITSQRAISTSVSANSTDRIVACTSGSSTDKTYTLPAPTGSGRIIDIFKVDSGSKYCLIATAAGTMNGASTLSLTTQYFGETCWDQASNVWICRGSAT